MVEVIDRGNIINIEEVNHNRMNKIPSPDKTPTEDTRSIQPTVFKKGSFLSNDNSHIEGQNCELEPPKEKEELEEARRQRLRAMVSKKAEAASNRYKKFDQTKSNNFKSDFISTGYNSITSNPLQQLLDRKHSNAFLMLNESSSQRQANYLVARSVIHKKQMKNYSRDTKNKATFLESQKMTERIIEMIKNQSSKSPEREAHSSDRDLRFDIDLGPPELKDFMGLQKGAQKKPMLL